MESIKSKCLLLLSCYEGAPGSFSISSSALCQWSLTHVQMSHFSQPVISLFLDPRIWFFLLATHINRPNVSSLLAFSHLAPQPIESCGLTITRIWVGSGRNHPKPWNNRERYVARLKIPNSSSFSSRKDERSWKGMSSQTRKQVNVLRVSFLNSGGCRNICLSVHASWSN